LTPPAFAVQSISATASVMSPSSVLIGLASLTVFCVCVHPGIGRTSTPAIGVSVGNCTCRPVVEAVSLSVGTRNVITASEPPLVAPGALIVTCADAGAASASIAMNIADTAMTRRMIPFQ